MTLFTESCRVTIRSRKHRQHAAQFFIFLSNLIWTHCDSTFITASKAFLVCFTMSYTVRRRSLTNWFTSSMNVPATQQMNVSFVSRSLKGDDKHSNVVVCLCLHRELKPCPPIIRRVDPPAGIRPPTKLLLHFKNICIRHPFFGTLCLQPKFTSDTSERFSFALIFSFEQDSEDKSAWCRKAGDAALTLWRRKTIEPNRDMQISIILTS